MPVKLHYTGLRNKAIQLDIIINYVHGEGIDIINGCVTTAW